MPLLDPELPPAVCAAIDWSDTVVAERRLSRARAVREPPTRMLPLTCIRGELRPGRFVDDAGRVYREADALKVLATSPASAAYVDWYRKARVTETAFTVAAVASLGTYGTIASAIVARNSHEDAVYALARAVDAYNSTELFETTLTAYADVESSRPLAVVRFTELLLEARGCEVSRSDPRFDGYAAVVEAQAGRGAAELMEAARSSELPPCDLEGALNPPE